MQQKQILLTQNDIYLTQDDIYNIDIYNISTYFNECTVKTEESIRLYGYTHDEVKKTCYDVSRCIKEHSEVSKMLCNFIDNNMQTKINTSKIIYKAIKITCRAIDKRNFPYVISKF